MISAGELDRQVQLQHDTPSTDSAFNEQTPSYATYATVWAKMEFHRSTESEAAARQYADQGLYFTIRWRSDVLAEDRIVFESRAYQIIGRPREMWRRKFLKIQARLIE